MGSAAAAIISLQHARAFSGALWPQYLEFTLALLAGPLLYAYVRTSLDPDWTPTARQWLHVVPAGVCSALTLLSALRALPWNVPIEVILLHQISYTALTARTFFAMVRSRPAERGSLEQSWARNILILVAVLHAVQLTRLEWSHVPELRDSVPAALALGLLGLGFLAFQQAHARFAAVSLKYSHSSLRPEDVSLHLARLTRLMDEEKLYTDPRLTLAALARRLSLPAHHLSQILNQHRGKSFFDWVNDYRVQDCQQKLLDPAQDRFTIDAIAESAGFASRSAFYSAFRRSVRVAPTEFRRRRRTGLV